MKQIVFVLLAFVFCLSASFASESPFHLEYENPDIMDVGIFTDSSDFMFPFPKKSDGINALSICGNVRINGNNGHVRVLLQDSNGYLYQIAEFAKWMGCKDYFEFSNYCEETISLQSIKPKSIIIYSKNAQIRINQLRTVPQDRKVGTVCSRQDQIKEIVYKINEFNEQNGKLWRAGVTELSLKGYQEKSRILGLDSNSDTQGIEYYSEGIFEMGYKNPSNKSRQLTSPQNNYVPEFDWRNRHSKNWVTPVKNQGNSGYCWAFSTVAATEAMMNLYFNQLLNLDLAEQDVGLYTYGMDTNGRAIGYNGGNDEKAIKYIKDYGVVDESSIPFIDTPYPNLPPTRTLNFLEKIRISSYTRIAYTLSESNIGNIKRALFTKGVLCSGVRSIINHTMALVGYGTICQGDTLTWYANGNGDHGSYVGNNDSRIGKTYWKFKNSDGPNPGYGVNGYLYVYFVDDNCMRETFSIETPIYSENFDSSDIICEDADGDGYYFWGIGTRPSSCPSWAPIEPDGDDSDYSKGPLDEYGWLKDLNPDISDTIHITNDTTWNTYQYLHNHVCICNGSKLTIKNTIQFYRNVSIIIQPNATLSVDGGNLDNAIVKTMNQGHIELLHNGKINPPSNYDFSIPLGAMMGITYGSIK